jgi:hypothetical protein
MGSHCYGRIIGYMYWQMNLNVHPIIEITRTASLLIVDRNDSFDSEATYAVSNGSTIITVYKD